MIELPVLELSTLALEQSVPFQLWSPLLRVTSVLKQWLLLPLEADSPPCSVYRLLHRWFPFTVGVGVVGAIAGWFWSTVCGRCWSWWR